jgi:hypothetical protein
MIEAVRHQERQGGKSLQNLRSKFRAGKTLQQLLENNSGRQYRSTLG